MYFGQHHTQHLQLLPNETNELSSQNDKWPKHDLNDVLLSTSRLF